MNEEKFLLMHKNFEVAEISFIDRSYLSKVHKILTPERYPLYYKQHKFKYDSPFLREFFNNRVIPNSRRELRSILDYYQSDNSIELGVKNFFVSISDHYWLKPNTGKHSSLTWEDVNFYNKDFSDEYIFLYKQIIGDNIRVSNLTPNSCSNGSLPQMWEKKDGELFFLKGGSGINQQPYNEVIASKMLSILKLDHVEYFLEKDKTIFPISSCKAFTNNELEFIPADIIRNAVPNNSNPYKSFFNDIKQFKLSGIQKKIDNMLQFDYLIVNTDRHFNNFGFIRNSNTLEIVDLAPIFDNGTSLYSNIYYLDYQKIRLECTSKPFNADFEKQLLKTHHQLDHLDKLKPHINKIITETLSEAGNFPKERIDFIIRNIEKRANNLEKFFSKGREI